MEARTERMGEGGKTNFSRSGHPLRTAKWRKNVVTRSTPEVRKQD
jgi:hypothetical protein